MIFKLLMWFAMAECRPYLFSKTNFEGQGQNYTGNCNISIIHTQGTRMVLAEADLKKVF